MKPRLTIAIPTYNGASTIRRTLESIVNQLTQEVDVVISDNASTDGLYDQIKKYLSDYPSIRYFKNDQNLGYDKNVDLCIKYAEGEYVWLFSDNDVLLKGGIEKILRRLSSSEKLSALFVNYDSLHSPRVTDFVLDNTVYKGDSFFLKTSFKSGLISSNIVNKEIWGQSNMKKYMGSGWIHLGFLVEALQICPAGIVKECLIQQLEVPMKWGANGSFFNVGLSAVRIYESMESLGYSKETVRKAVLTIKNAHSVISAKSRGLKINAELLRECVHLFKNFPSFWVVDLPLLLIPGFFYRGLLSLKRG
jgi:abequosyltransferase